MAKQQNPYPLRMSIEVMAKLKVVAKSHGRSVNKELEILAQKILLLMKRRTAPSWWKIREQN